jgi:hypothetical protein
MEIAADSDWLLGAVIRGYTALILWPIRRGSIHPEVHNVPLLSFIDRPSVPPGFLHVLAQRLKLVAVAVEADEYFVRFVIPAQNFDAMILGEFSGRLDEFFSRGACSAWRNLDP